MSAEDLKRAKADLNNIQVLRNNHAFVEYFMRRVGSMRSDAENKILKKGATASEMAEAKAVYDVLVDIENLLDQDEQGCRNLLVFDDEEVPGAHA